VEPNQSLNREGSRLDIVGVGGSIPPAPTTIHPRSPAAWAFAASDDVPAWLISKLRVMIPELLEANGVLPAEDAFPFSLIAQDRAYRHAA